MHREFVCFLLLGLAMLQGVTACGEEPRVTIATQQGRTITFSVEIADSPAKREETDRRAIDVLLTAASAHAKTAEADRTSPKNQ